MSADYRKQMCRELKRKIKFVLTAILYMSLHAKVQVEDSDPVQQPSCPDRGRHVGVA